MKKVVVLLIMGISFALADTISAYLQGEVQDVQSVKSKLSSGGFTVVGSSKVNEKGTLTSIVYTNDSLRTLADKDTRGFMSTLRVLVDEENSKLSFANPIYFCEAFMQGDNDKKVAEGIASKLTEIFGTLKNSKDSLEYDDLAGYHFMFGMPYFSDMEVIASSTSSEDLLAYLKSKYSEKLLFTNKISKDRILIGVKLSEDTSKFIDKIGTNNALVLPYPILLENGKAKILAPKYYLAISYPALKMTQFMTISDIPGKISQDCKNLFK